MKKLLVIFASAVVLFVARAAQLTINVGSSANDGTGDTLRGAFGKVNTNFTELFSYIGGTNRVLQVGTVAQMQAVNPTNSPIVIVDGYASRLDGGGGIFSATNTITSTNYSTRIVSTNYPTWSWQRIYGSTFDTIWAGGGTNRIGIGTTAPVAEIDVRSEGSGVSIAATNSADGAVFDLWRNDATPLAGDRLGEIHFYGNASNGTKTQEAAIYAETRDPTAGQVSGRLMMNVTGDSALLPFFQADGDNRRVDWFQGLVTTDAWNMRMKATSTDDAFFFLGVGGSGNIGLNTNSPANRLVVVGTNTSSQASAVMRLYSSNTKGLWFGYSTDNSVGLIGAATDGASHDNMLLAPLGGNVGIGMQTIVQVPGSLLSVGGNLSVGATYDQLAAPASGAIFEGRVGFGVSSPSARVHIVGDFVAAPAALSDGSNIATIATNGNHFIVTLSGSRTLDNPTGGVHGQRITWEIIQDGTGSRTLAYGSKFTFGTDIPNGTLTTTAAKRDFLTAYYNSSADKWYVIDFKKGY